MEGRFSAAAHTALIDSAAASNMNTLRVWGGGIFLPEAFYAAADERGILIFHDMMYHLCVIPIMIRTLDWPIFSFVF
jgi:beta-mannosidase